MSFSLNKCGLVILRYALAIVVLIEAILFVMPGAAREFAHTHMPGFIRLTLGFGEILGSILLLIPQTAVRGAWFLLAVFVMAIFVHLMHGQYNVGNVVIYAAAAFAIAAGE